MVTAKLAPITSFRPNETLSSIHKSKGDARVQEPMEKIKSTTTVPQLENAEKITIHGQPSQLKPVVKESCKGKNKREMQPFTISPRKKQNVSFTSFDPKLSGSKRKKGKVVENREKNGSAIVQLKREREYPKRKRLPTLQKALENPTLELNESASDDMEDALDTEDEDAGWKSRGESSGAEVKGDSDYHP